MRSGYSTHYVCPRLWQYMQQLRATREKDYADFIKRRDQAIARQAVEEQGIGD